VIATAEKYHITDAHLTYLLPSAVNYNNSKENI